MSVFMGRVMKGKRRGSALGYPTINILLAEHATSGVFAAVVTLAGVQHYAAAFADPQRGTLEAHILDYSGDIYGTEVTIELRKRIRDAEQFENDAALRDAISEDVRSVRQYFSL